MFSQGSFFLPVTIQRKLNNVLTCDVPEDKDIIFFNGNIKEVSAQHAVPFCSIKVSHSVYVSETVSHCYFSVWHMNLPNQSAAKRRFSYGRTWMLRFLETQRG